MSNLDNTPPDDPSLSDQIIQHACRANLDRLDSTSHFTVPEPKSSGFHGNGKMKTIRKPAAWSGSTIEDLMGCEAGRACILKQLDPKSDAIGPDHRLQSSRTNCDPQITVLDHPPTNLFRRYENPMSFSKQNQGDEAPNEWRQRIRDSLEPMIRSSSVVALASCDPQDIDAKVAVELGISVMMNKPIIALVKPGTQIPEKLARVVDRFVEMNRDDPEATADGLRQAMLDLIEEGVIKP